MPRNIMLTRFGWWVMATAMVLLFETSSLLLYACAWITTTTSMASHRFHPLCIQSQQHRFIGARSAGTTRLFLAASSSSSPSPLPAKRLPEGYQEKGEAIIRQAGLKCGITQEKDLSITWKPDRIIVTVHASNVFLSNPMGEDNDDDVVDADENIDADDDNGEDMDNEKIDETIMDESSGALIEQEEEVDEEEDSSLVSTLTSSVASAEPSSPTSGVDVTQLAKAINISLDQDPSEVGLVIAQTHEIEVTTPGAPDELSGIMFEAYKGFEVICQQQDLKTSKIKQVIGRLVERNDQFTILNIKGKPTKLKNDMVLSVKLPKAKKEKGSK